MNKLNQTGATHLVAILIAVMIVAIGVIGYRVATIDDATTSNTVNEIADSSSAVEEVPASIESKADLDQADAALSDTDLNAVESSQLDADINSL